MANITQYEIEDIGIEHPQYFTGRSTAHTTWDHVYLGVGFDPLDAYDQAISDARENGWDCDEINLKERALYHYVTDLETNGKFAHREKCYVIQSHWSQRDMHQEGCPILETIRGEDAECDGCELMYHIAIWIK